MESKNELKEIDIKNRTSYYFNDIIRARNRDISSSDISLVEKLYKKNYGNILLYNISYQTSTVGCKTIAYYVR